MTFNPKKGIRFAVGLLLALLVVGAGALLYFNSLLAPVAKEAQQAEMVEIPANSSGAAVAAMLEERGLIKSSLAFRVYCRYKGLDSEIKTGEYELGAHMSTPEIIESLIQGSQVYYSFTIPEGYTVEQIADLLYEQGFVNKEKFLQLCKEGDFDFPFLPKKQEDIRYRLEGYLFPNTYSITRHDDEESIILMMLERFVYETNNINFEERAKALGLTVHEAVTVAAMIEREAKVEKDRPLIAGVIYNRLKINMPLQIDATVLYALGEHKETVLYKDLEVKSPYNTYYINTMPVGPIANPGLSSLEATVKPDKNDYLYYVAKPDGSHVFSKTLEEHELNKAKYL
ncbi:endolytic transglycosylase MltG [Desulfofalx alkaliphila]|uniref:endolytic transglycosylase MltG n=1 Tax=Desulfofalx alkaliphila TaxID=105483 RepID=UPI0004E17460|nr:endolytic transglycosylase MltG [Desulfofalx alkaliphila]